MGTYQADAIDRERLADTDGLAYEEYYESPLTIEHDGLCRNVISLEFCEDGLTPVCLMDGGDGFPLPLENLSCDTLQGIVEWLEEYDFIPSAEAAPQTTSDLTEDFVERCLPEYPTRYDVFRLGELQNFLDGHESGRRKFRPSDNSRDTAATLIAWGDEFSRQHEDTDWTEKEFLDEIYRFTAEKLQSVPNKDDPNAEFDIAFLNRTALERHGYDTATITDGDLQELAGRMGDYYCESSKFSEDLRTACGDFGLKLRDTTNPK